MIFEDRLKNYVSMAAKYVNLYFERAAGNAVTKKQKTIYDAMMYCIKAGGKRIRPVLSLAVAEFAADYLGKDDAGKKALLEKAAPFACAVEMIHTYSLIHDDLPCMDDDELRRGMPTCHIVYGEAMAVLAGDGLLNISFEIMNLALADALAGAKDDISSIENCIKATKLISECSGCRGMIGGQVIDIESENKEIDKDTLDCLQKLKTGALIRAAIMSSALACGLPDDICEKLNVYAELLGRLFQITDDILDFESTSEMMGKTVGKDERDGKSTYVTLYGLEYSKKEADLLELRMTELFEDYESAAFLKAFAHYVRNRKS